MKTKNMTIPNWCGKFVSALAVLSVSMFGTSCNDEEFADSTRKPLQLSVTANAPFVSRAIINDTYLPDGSQIGVTLTATDGSAYDNQDFYNLAYTASGTGAEQVWSSATPASLSTTSGKVIAYYPYNGTEELDLTAIPVETASQTDYMYAKPVTGIDFSSADINLNMQHAMTDIRINLKKGTYTGTGDVTKVTVKAAAFATSATMDAETGVFANVSGSGAQFVQEFTELTLTTTAYSQDFLMVPDTKSTSGEVSILTIVDGKKFAVTVPYTESFQQGYSYVYNLTLDNSGLVLEGVDVTKWSVKMKEEQELEFYDNQYIVEIQVPSDNYTYRHNNHGFEGTIDWGDGTTTEYTEPTQVISHIYSSSGKYIVVSKGKSNSISSNNADKIITKLIHIGKEVGVTNMHCAFVRQELLTEIVPGALDGCTEVTDFSAAFEGCKGLQTIPVGLFDKCTKVTNFYGCFSAYYLHSNISCAMSFNVIPMGLFDHCTEVTDFSHVFQGCTSLQAIPDGLFDNNTKVTSFQGAFRDCYELQTIPEGLFDKNTKVTSFGATFQGCTRLASIPQGLFDKCTEVTSFGKENLSYIYGTFYGCRNLQAIPEGLFDYNTKVTSFYGTFHGCVALQAIPDGLFDHCTEVTDFQLVFQECKKIQAIPEGLFDYNTKVTDFEFSFAECSGLMAIPEGLFDKCTEVTTFCYTFWECTSLTAIPEGLFDYNTKVTKFGGDYANSGCFSYCSKLEIIPSGLFDKCTEVTNFTRTFAECKSLKQIPEGLFNHNTKVTKFQGTFAGCTNLQAIPDGLFDKCTKVTSFGSAFWECSKLQEIPEGLFDNCTEVTTFEGTFGYCYNLQAIPEGLFDKCTEVTNFANAFRDTNITEIPEGLFDKCTKVVYFGATFKDCESLELVPINLFDKCFVVKEFTRSTLYQNSGGCFENCTNIHGESPYTVINLDGVDTKVHLYERSLYPDLFTAPTSYNDCFYNCTGLTDYSSIPSSWL